MTRESVSVDPAVTLGLVVAGTVEPLTALPWNKEFNQGSGNNTDQARNDKMGLMYYCLYFSVAHEMNWE